MPADRLEAEMGKIIEYTLVSQIAIVSGLRGLEGLR